MRKFAGPGSSLGSRTKFALKSLAWREPKYAQQGLDSIVQEGASLCRARCPLRNIAVSYSVVSAAVEVEPY